MAIDLGFYYKDSNAVIDMDALLAQVIAKALSPWDAAELSTMKVSLDELLRGDRAAERLTKMWMARKPLVTFWEGTDPNVERRGVEYVFEKLRAAIEEKLAGP
ncbi:hypothetical protein [Methylosinus sp. Sm6]|uniref:hypothetical protein n=1 Tax=Methylosinus sp. Sm6 TaxID=2866948 RepID=UPI001C9928FD|nr:hypothetical protein [Methylosinus sp. Sm6]MBY6239743.1 hypothetical protein [Methylosinus sp. Sm6]